MSDSATVSKHLLLQSFKRNLASEYAVPVAEQNSKYIRTLETKVNILEKDIVRTIPTYNDIIRQVSWQEVQTKLSPGSIAIEFVRYQLGHPRRLDSTTIAMVKAELETAPIAEFKERERYSSYSSIERAADSTFNADFERHFKITAEVFGHLEYTDSTMYAAIVLRASDSLPQFVPLFEEKQLAALLKGAAGGSNFLKINALYSEKNLCDLIWKPLEKHLEGISTIYCSPAGLLHRINLAALQPANNSGERQVVLLGSTRTLVLPNETIQAGHDNAYLAGGIRYDGDSTAIAIANLKNAAHRSIELQEGTPVFQPDISGTRSDAFNYLPATATEVRGIGEILASAGISAQIDTGFFATEETFRHLGVNEPSPRIVHLATHGYFFPDPESSLPKAGESLEKEPVFKVSLHPMIRSGLIMAGAREAWTTGKHPKGQEDGILTAYEISQMDLSGTELVVLSACETALGDIAGNEGVYGLQRAFKIAGAKYLIMSLWKVDDRSTQEFMTAFYRHWLAGKMSIPEAFRMAQQEMKVKYPSPYDWAGLVLVE